MNETPDGNVTSRFAAGRSILGGMREALEGVGSRIPITLVTCGLGGAGRQSDRGQSPCLKARVRPVG